MRFSISPRSYTYFATLTLCILLVLHFTFLYGDLVQGSRIAKFFSFRHELNLPTFLSTLNLYVASLLSFLCCLAQKNKRSSRFFGFVAFILLIMGYDEAAGLHEHLGSRYSYLLPEGLKLTSVDWINLYLPIASILGLFLLIELIKTLNRPLKLLLPALLFLTGSICFEWSHSFMSLNNTFLGSIFETIEESLEIVSIIWLNHSLITVLKDAEIKLKIIFKD